MSLPAHYKCRSCPTYMPLHRAFVLVASRAAYNSTPKRHTFLAVELCFVFSCPSEVGSICAALTAATVLNRTCCAL